jgi:tRNA modification GTPase
MSGYSADTIAAIATAAGSAAISVVRVSGPGALAIAAGIAGPKLRPRAAQLRELRTPAGDMIDTALVLSFPGPHSYTGEDLIEFQIHGSAVIADWLLETIYAAGARPANPGEFTLRAFLNDKLDLTQAEAVADLVASQSRAGAGAAGRSLQGEFSSRVGRLQSRLTQIRVQLEAHLDFPDEDIDPAEHQRLRADIDAACEQIDALRTQARNGVVLRDGLNVAIAGPPNAGKSSLLNRLAGYDAAIVTEIPGTTRDPLREQLVLDGLPVQIVDTAGLRDTEDPIEREGARRAHAAAAQADRILWVFDVREGEQAARKAAGEAFATTDSVTLVLNKTDLCEDPSAQQDAAADTVRISALTGTGINALIAHLKASAGWREGAEGTFTARRRHLDALDRAYRRLDAARLPMAAQPELAAEELRMAQTALGEITGDFTSDDLLGEIFSSFCIGK